MADDDGGGERGDHADAVAADLRGGPVEAPGFGDSSGSAEQSTTRSTSTGGRRLVTLDSAKLSTREMDMLSRLGGTATDARERALMGEAADEPSSPLLSSFDAVTSAGAGAPEAKAGGDPEQGSGADGFFFGEDFDGTLKESDEAFFFGDDDGGDDAHEEAPAAQTSVGRWTGIKRRILGQNKQSSRSFANRLWCKCCGRQWSRRQVADSTFLAVLVGCALLSTTFAIIVSSGTNWSYLVTDIPQGWVTPMNVVIITSVSFLTLEIVLRWIILRCHVGSRKMNTLDAIAHFGLVLSLAVRSWLSPEALESVDSFAGGVGGTVSFLAIICCVVRFLTVNSRHRTKASLPHVSAAVMRLLLKSALGKPVFRSEKEAARRDEAIARDLASRNRFRIGRQFFPISWRYIACQKPFIFALVILCNAIWAVWGAFTTYFLTRVQNTLNRDCTSSDDCVTGAVCFRNATRAAYTAAGQCTSATGETVTPALEHFLSFMMVGWFVIEVVAQGGVYFLFSRLEGAANSAMRKDIVKFVVGRESNLDRFSHEDVIDMFHSDVPLVSGMWGYTLALWSVLQAGVSVIVSIIYTTMIDPWAALIMLICLMIMFVQVLPSAAFKRASQEHSKQFGALSGQFKTLVQGRQTLDNTGTTGRWISEFDTRNRRVESADFWQAWTRKSIYYVWYCAPQGFAVIIFILSAAHLDHAQQRLIDVHPKITVSQLVSIFSLVNSIAGRLGGMASFFNALDNSAATLARLLSVLESVRYGDHAPREGDVGNEPPRRISLERSIEFDDISLTYVTKDDPDEGMMAAGGAGALELEEGSTRSVSTLLIPSLVIPVERDAHGVAPLFMIEGGSRQTRRAVIDLAVLRRSGSLERGRLHFDGVVPTDDPRTVAGVVGACFGLSEMQLLPGATVMQNVLFGRQATPREVHRACELAGCAHWVKKLQSGYDTRLTSDTGSLLLPLSRAQVFQVSLARSLLVVPKILFVELWTMQVGGRRQRRGTGRRSSAGAGGAFERDEQRELLANLYVTLPRAGITTVLLARTLPHPSRVGRPGDVGSMSPPGPAPRTLSFVSGHFDVDWDHDGSADATVRQWTLEADDLDDEATE